MTIQLCLNIILAIKYTSQIMKEMPSLIVCLDTQTTETGQLYSCCTSDNIEQNNKV